MKPLVYHLRKWIGLCVITYIYDLLLEVAVAEGMSRGGNVRVYTGWGVSTGRDGSRSAPREGEVGEWGRGGWNTSG